MALPGCRSMRSEPSAPSCVSRALTPPFLSRRASPSTKATACQKLPQLRTVLSAIVSHVSRQVTLRDVESPEWALVLIAGTKGRGR